MTQRIIQQGAEAKIILSETAKSKFVIKDRIKKSYRLPELDEKIRVRRTRSEIKLLNKASEIINSPKPIADRVSRNSTKIRMPFIQGQKLSESLNKFDLKKQKQICKIIGQNISKIHDAGLIHGDLTTSNMILSESSDDNLGNKKSNNLVKSKLSVDSKTSVSDSEQDIRGRGKGNEGLKNDDLKIFFIDFGLGFHSNKIEDKAVDLHLLRQALEAKHFKNWRALFNSVLQGYKKSKDYKKVLEQFKKVEARGRYKDNY